MCHKMDGITLYCGTVEGIYMYFVLRVHDYDQCVLVTMALFLIVLLLLTFVHYKIL